MRVNKEELKQLIQTKLQKAGLIKEHAHVTADVLVHANLRGGHSHGAMRVEYYAERIAKGGINIDPHMELEETGPSTAIYHADNGIGHYAADRAMDEAISIAKENGVAIMGVKNMSHSGALSYVVEKAANAKMIGISICQSDPMVVPYGGTEPYYGTNPIAFSAPGKDGKNIIFDMATTVQAWGKVLHARSKNEPIDDDWAVNANGEATTDPHDVKALLPIAGPKGYGLMMMVDILSGILLGLPFGKNVTSMYEDLTEYRKLGQLHIVINPAFFTSIDGFLEHITETMTDLNAIKPAQGFDEVLYPGQPNERIREEYERDGIKIVDDIYAYLISEDIHYGKYDHKDPFAE